MVIVRKATLDLFDRIYPLIESFGIEGVSREDWFQLLSKHWFPDHDHFGYVLMEGEQVVGFLGASFSERNIGGNRFAVCNLFCWYVWEDYRKESLLLLRPILNLPNMTITTLTPSQVTSIIFERFKFEKLERQVMIFPLLPSLSLQTGIEFVTDPLLIESQLAGDDKKIFVDHSFAPCCHLLLTHRGQKEYCYLIYNRVQKKGLHFTQVCFISNKDLFASSFARVKWFFLRQKRTVFTVVDKRLIKGCKVGLGFNYTLRYPRLYRSDTLQPEEIDNLYSELLFLECV